MELLDPPHGVRAEAMAPAIVEALGGSHQPDVALLREIDERDVGAGELPGDGHREAQVGLDELAPRPSDRAARPGDRRERGLDARALGRRCVGSGLAQAALDPLAEGRIERQIREAGDELVVCGRGVDPIEQMREAGASGRGGGGIEPVRLDQQVLDGEHARPDVVRSERELAPGEGALEPRPDDRLFSGLDPAADRDLALARERAAACEVGVVQGEGVVRGEGCAQPSRANARSGRAALVVGGDLEVIRFGLARGQREGGLHQAGSGAALPAGARLAAVSQPAGRIKKISHPERNGVGSGQGGDVLYLASRERSVSTKPATGDMGR